MGLTWCWATPSLSLKLLYRSAQQDDDDGEGHDDDQDDQDDDQVDQEEAELFLTPGMTWTTTGNLAQAEVSMLMDFWIRGQFGTVM